MLFALGSACLGGGPDFDGLSSDDTTIINYTIRISQRLLITNGLPSAFLREYKNLSLDILRNWYA